MGRKPSGLNYEGGSFYRQDDRSGFTVRAGSTKREWNNLLVDQKLWEIRQPQDFVKGVLDDQTAPDARPLPPPVYQGPIYATLSAKANVTATFIPLTSIANLTAGDKIGIMLDINQWFYTTISGNPTSTGVNISAPLPYSASAGNVLVDFRNG